MCSNRCMSTHYWMVWCVCVCVCVCVCFHNSEPRVSYFCHSIVETVLATLAFEGFSG